MSDAAPTKSQIDGSNPPLSAITVGLNGQSELSKLDAFDGISTAEEIRLNLPLQDALERTSSNFSDISACSHELERTGRLLAPLAGNRLLSRSSAPSPTHWEDKVTKAWVKNKGLALVVISQFFGVLMNGTTRLLEVEGHGLDPFQILFARMGGTFILSSLYQCWAKVPDAPFGPRKVWPLLLARGVCGFFGVMGLYYSLQYLPLADATVIGFLAPLVACWVCSMILHEPFTRKEQIAGVISFLGVVLIARPTSLIPSKSGGLGGSGPADSPPSTNGTSARYINATDTVTSSQRLGAVGMAMVGVLGASGAYTTIRWIGKQTHPLVSVNYYAFFCTVISTIALCTVPSINFKLPANGLQWFYLFFLGTTGFIMQFMLTAGLAYEKSSRATNMVYVQMLFALAFDKIVFNMTPTLLSIAGSSLILGSALYVAIMNNKAKEAKELSPERREEEEMGLMNNQDDDENDEHDIQQAQLRTMRT